MINFIVENLGTIAVGLVLAAIVTAIVTKIIKDKKKGKNIICDCSNCSSCHCSSNCAPAHKH